ncbi:alpha/beta hydrolase family protein [Bythopirellula polymerisocia]|uniref:Acetyl xylan esterase (AXE1) n=1 Tax=Bythopirellula polymerisocia TaxID=2528003 RepID=A0A5C6D2T2_9BACT|nr:acetylxylan esterase [Bythopirellula polymerisocia]TWU29516.1 Acetyl xylan esterase (AXE1) [Bythopirellula polymerisocia]
MKLFYLYAYTLFFLLNLFLVDASHSQVVTLIRGRAYTETVAEEKLAKLAESYSDQAAWQERAEMLRTGMRRGMQLEGLPPPCELKPIRHSKREMDGYTVENVAFESLPGFWVTGNLYLPVNIEGKIPGILNPHGHWGNARMTDQTQARCAAQARMGAAAFAYDMVGYGESKQCEHRRFQVQRLQTYNSMRAIDFLLSLGIIDEDRLAVTGASGGGTQTFLLSAIDDRIDLSIPVAQVSAHFFGGCECESAMPIHKTDEYETNNVEIAALMAPKPQLLVSDGGDWTVNTPQVEFPHVQRIYSFLDAADNVENAHFANEGHDYGPSKRAAAYRFLAKHFGLNLAAVENSLGEIDEAFFKPIPEDELRVFTAEHPRPDYAITDCEEVLGLLNKK